MDNVYIIKSDGKKVLLCSTAKSGSMTYHKLTLKLNDPGNMELKIPATNAKAEGMAFLMDEITFERNGVELFRGCAYNGLKDILNTGRIKIKGALDYFANVYMEPYSFAGSPEEYLDFLVDHYNSRVLPNKQILKGIMNVTDPNDYIVRSNSDRVLVSKLLKEKLVDNLGGYMYIRVDNGIKYLDYVADFENVANQEITYGGNILDISQEIDYSDVYTVIVPVGKKNEETGENVTIESVNNGLTYIADEEAVAKFGWREFYKKWDDVTLPENLFTKAKAELDLYTNPVKEVTVKAVDLSQKSEDIDCFYVGDNIRSKSKPNGLDDTFLLTGMELYALNPEDEVLTLGEAKPVTVTMRTELDQLKEEQSYIQKSNWDLSNRIENADGLFTTMVERNDGSVVTYMHNRPSLSDSALRISFSSVGVFLSADRGETWYGMQMDGRTIVNMLQAYGIQADIIRGGTLTLGGENNGNGIERIYDKDGNLIMTINSLGIRAFAKEDVDAITAIDGNGVMTRAFVADQKIQMGTIKLIPRTTGGGTFQKANGSASDIIHKVVIEPTDEEALSAAMLMTEEEGGVQYGS